MKMLLPLLILSNCLFIQGVLEWTVIGKVTDYGQTVTLFCNVSNCCPKDAGWDRWTPVQQTLFIDVKTGRSNKKYDGKVLKDGYTLIIKNLTKEDLNVSYSCLYDVTLGKRKFLLEKDAFTYESTTQPNVPASNSILSQDEIAGLVTGIAIVIVSVLIFIYCWRHRNRKQDTEIKKHEDDPLIREFPTNKKDEYYNLRQRVTQLEREQSEVIPLNIRAQIRIEIEDWEKKDKNFVSTRASDYVMECFQDNSCLTLTGPPGVGKSFICRHTALVLQKEGYKIIPVYTPRDIGDYYQPGEQTVFIVDDICGNFTANQQQIENWKQMLPVIKKIIADKCCKIIVSCRLQVYKDEKFNILSPFKSCECNLISHKICLTSIEKTYIAETYVGTCSKDIDELSQNCEFFPLLCSLYHENENTDVKEFFRNPFVIYKRELDRLSEHGDEGNNKICSLALCVLFNNQLKEKWFQEYMTDEQRHIIEDTCDACEINRSTSKAKLKKALDTLDGTFIFKQNGTYSTAHDKLFDFLAHYFGQKMIKCLINHADSDLLHERFIWQTSSDDQDISIDFTIEIPDDYLESYLQRLMKDWEAGNVTVVFKNNNMKVSSFCQHLLQKLQRLDKSKQVALADTKDTVIPKAEYGSGNTPLIRACYGGYTIMVQWMLNNDVDMDQCRDDGVTGLIMSSQEGHTDIVRLLLERNSNIDLCDNDGCSPLYIASQEGHTDIVKLLLKRNPDIGMCTKDGRSPLHIASQNGHNDIVELLLETYLNVDLCDNEEGCSSLLMASQEGHTDIVKLLLERNPAIDLCSNDGCSPLYVASQDGHTSIVKLLLERNPDIDLCNKNGCSPLYIASQNGHTDTVKLLLENKSDVNLYRNDGCSPLYLASQAGYTDIVKLLLERNHNVDIYDNNGCTPLYIASQNGQTDVVSLLLEKNPKIDLRANDGRSPLYVASQNGHTDIVKLLLENNSDVNLCANNGCNPLYWARRHGHTDIVNLLLEKNPIVDLSDMDLIL